MLNVITAMFCSKFTIGHYTFCIVSGKLDNSQENVVQKSQRSRIGYIADPGRIARFHRLHDEVSKDFDIILSMIFYR